MATISQIKAEGTLYDIGAKFIEENQSTASTDQGGLYWFNVDGTAGAGVDVNDVPVAGWWYINRNRHTNASNDYYTDIAVPFNNLGIYYKNVRAGGVYGNRWNKVFDDTMTIPLANGGTGATTRSNSISNLFYMGTHPIASTSNDTVTN